MFLSQGRGPKLQQSNERIIGLKVQAFLSLKLCMASCLCLVTYRSEVDVISRNIFYREAVPET